MVPDPSLTPLENSTPLPYSAVDIASVLLAAAALGLFGRELVGLWLKLPSYACDPVRHAYTL